MANNGENIPPWLGWIVDRGVFFWRVVLLAAAFGLLGLAIFTQWRLQDIEEDLSYQPPRSMPHVDVVGVPDVIAKGQVVFVPSYSHVYHQEGRPFPLATTLSIHNTDDTQPLVVTSVEYYGTNGKRIRRYIEEPKQVGPLASLEFLVEERDVAGGSGAKFVVQWVAERRIHEPVVQTVMVGTAGGQGLSFVCNGVVLEELEEE